MSDRSIKMIKLEDGDYVPEECCTFCRNFETGEMEIDDIGLPCGGDCSCGGQFEDSCKGCTIQEIMNEYGRQKENSWIPVDERLPEASGTYQVTCMDGRIYRSTYAKFQCKLKRWELTGARAYWKVTAWMPLPEPYKED